MKNEDDFFDFMLIYDLLFIDVEDIIIECLISGTI